MKNKIIEIIVLKVLDGMTGIGGIPGNDEFCDEFDMRLRAALDVSHPNEEPKGSAEETRAIQKQDDKYHLACQNCGTTSQPLQMIPFRNDNHVVGLLTCCSECTDDLYGQRFDRECKFSPDPPTVETKKD